MTEFRSTNLVAQASTHDTYRASKKRGIGFLTNPNIPLWIRLLLSPMYIAGMIILVTLIITFGMFLIVPFILLRHKK